MAAKTFSTEHVDYLQRVGSDRSKLPAGVSWTTAPPDLRRLRRVNGVGVASKETAELAAASNPRQSSEDLFAGLFGYKIPVAFLIRGSTEGVQISVGTWSSPQREKASAAVLDSRLAIVSTVLDGMHLAIDLTDASATEIDVSDYPLTGMALGIPTLKAPDPGDPVRPMDRLIRAMGAGKWACLILAEPVDETVSVKLKRSVINEMRTSEAAQQAQLAASPLSQHYSTMLGVLLSDVTLGHSIGAWRTAVHLFGDPESYYRLASAWRAIFSGNESVPEPLTVVDLTRWEAADRRRIQNWEMPDTPSDEGPGSYRHPFQHQTLLNSAQLATCVHLPRREAGGFSVTTIPDFDVQSRAVSDDEALRIGTVVRGRSVTGATYSVGLKSLAKHVFVAGVTGAGKTNTVFSILKKAHRLGAPFLVVEPSKTEYRALLGDPDLAEELQVFTLGNENGVPLRLNPFEVIPGTPVGVHLDLLRSVFTASFGMWSPLPQVLEQCFHRIYEDRGWDLASSTNRRLDPDTDMTLSFPTLSDLVSKVDEVTNELGYGTAQVTGDMRAALKTRLNSLRSGGKGRMLDVQRSIPMDVLLERPTILELQDMGDDDDKAFLMGLLFIRLVEYRRSQEKRSALHLLVIEEAHRLLANVAVRGKSQDQADPRGKAVENFANLLAEIRAYGQGVIVADQVPVKLAPDVIKNTTLKIAHRVVDADDRAALGGAMAMNNLQFESLAILPVGRAAVFSEGDDSPVLVQVDNFKGRDDWESPSTDLLVARMATTMHDLDDLFVRHYGCAETRGGGTACEAAGRVAELPAFQSSLARLCLAIVEDDSALVRLWPEIVAHARPALRDGIEEARLLRCLVARGVDRVVSRRGDDTGLRYGDVEGLRDALFPLLLAKIAGEDASILLAHYREVVFRLHVRDWDPYARCSSICKQEPAVCLYRSDASLPIRRLDISAGWKQARETDRQNGNGSTATWNVCLYVARTIIGQAAPADVLTRAGLCYGQLMLTRETDMLPESRALDIDELIETADAWLAAEGQPAAPPN